MRVREMLMHRKLGWLAVIGPLLALGSIAFCVLESPWFDWRDNAISDFGVHSVAPLFNTSLMVCGIMCSVFAAGSIMRLDSILGKAGMFVMMLACISLVGVGVFNEDWSPHHYYFSVAFFVLLLISILVLGLYFLTMRNTRIMSLAGLAVTVVGIFGWAYHFTVGWGSNVAIPEALTFVPGGLWFALVGYWDIRQRKSLNARAR